jgi:hypothetical protein
MVNKNKNKYKQIQTKQTISRQKERNQDKTKINGKKNKIEHCHTQKEKKETKGDGILDEAQKVKGIDERSSFVIRSEHTPVVLYCSDPVEVHGRCG